MREYVLAFCFDTSSEEVLLLQKRKPYWQKGLLNGVGGELRHEEKPIDCLFRKLKSEINLDLCKTSEAIDYTGLFTDHENFRIHVYGIFLCNLKSFNLKSSLEEHQFLDMNTFYQTPQKLVQDLRWLIPFVLEKHFNTTIHSKPIVVVSNSLINMNEARYNFESEYESTT